MANQGTPSSSFPPSLGPGARPAQPGMVAGADGSPGEGLAEVMHIRSTYQINVESEHLNLSYELDGRIRSRRLAFDAVPMGDFRKWLLFGGPRRSYASGVQVIDYIRAAENMAGRPSTQTEAEGLAYYAAKRVGYTMTGNFAGTLIGGVIGYRTRELMKFPFRKAQPLERYDKFPNRYLTLATGSTARMAWQITRINIWAMLCVFVVSPLFTTMGNIAVDAGLVADTRTQGIVREMKGNIERIGSNRASAARNRPASRQPVGSQSDQREQNGDQGVYQDQSSQDWERDSQTGDYSDDPDFSRDDTTNQQQPTQPSRRGFGNVRDRVVGNVPQRDAATPSNPEPFFYDDDDASPTAGNRALSGTGAPYEQSQGGSVWANIRRGGSHPPSNQPAQQPDSPSPQASPRGWNRAGQTQDQQSDNSSDSFSFSKTDADKQLAREQAQKEFDAMLDRERSESGSDDYDRGMKAVESGQESQASSGGSAWDQRRRRN